MQVKTLFLTPLIAASMVSAAPKKTTAEIFQGLALRSASDIHFNYLQASEERFSLKLKKQGASCDRNVKTNEATFVLSDGELFLYKTDNPPQQVYVDRSWMGQGTMGYTTGAQPRPRNAEEKGWALDKTGNLTFDGKGFIACPNTDKKDKPDGTWAVWVYAGVDQPGWGKNCVSFDVRAAKVSKPVGCYYSNVEQ